MCHWAKWPVIVFCTVNEMVIKVVESTEVVLESASRPDSPLQEDTHSICLAPFSTYWKRKLLNWLYPAYCISLTLVVVV